MSFSRCFIHLFHSAYAVIEIILLSSNVIKLNTAPSAPNSINIRTSLGVLSQGISTSVDDSFGQSDLTKGLANLQGGTVVQLQVDRYVILLTFNHAPATLLARASHEPRSGSAHVIFCPKRHQASSM
ncbi:hypothetical protein ACU8KH_03731 [Lachancea thermotolerans]